eukprot:UN02759
MGAIVAIVALLCLIYHLFNGNLLVFLWFTGFSMHFLIFSPLFQTQILGQRMGRPFRTPSLKDDFNEIKKGVSQVQKEMKKELEQDSK